MKKIIVIFVLSLIPVSAFSDHEIINSVYQKLETSMVLVAEHSSVCQINIEKYGFDKTNRCELMKSTFKSGHKFQEQLDQFSIPSINRSVSYERQKALHYNLQKFITTIEYIKQIKKTDKVSL